MRIVSDLAGFTLAQADSLRRAIGKKIPEVMAKEKKAFVDGAVKREVKEKVAEKIWELIDFFSGYGFNKSHSTAYAAVSYQTAYLKAHYPVEFMTALLTSEMNNTDKVVQYIEASKKMGIDVLPPAVNESFSDFTCVGNHIITGPPSTFDGPHQKWMMLVMPRLCRPSLRDYAVRGIVIAAPSGW